MNIYLLTDGMCESPLSSTSLMNSNHPNLDVLTEYGRLGFYEPIIRDYVRNPETFIVFPYFFGLKPENNPGRVGLELFELKNDISKLQSFCIVRIVPKDYNIFEVLSDESVGMTWTKAPKINNLDIIQSSIDKVANFVKNIIITKSPRRDNVWSIGGLSKTDLEDAMNLIQFMMSPLGYNVYPMLMNDFKYNPSNIISENTVSFLGWGFSSLIEAFRFSGIQIHQSFIDIKNHLFEYQRKHKDFDENILPYMKSLVNSKDSCVLFFKEPSRAARENFTSEVKIESIKFVDEIVAKILEEFIGQNVNLIVLSDHQSNVGSKRTFSGPTLYYYGNLSKKISQKGFFSEKDVSGSVCSQVELIKRVNDYINKNNYEK